MLKKRVIFTLLYDSGYFMLSRNFSLQKVGNMQWLKKNYNFAHISFSIDELIILDVSREERNDELFHEHLRLLNDESFVPIAAGGGIREVEQARKLLHSGADKVVLNTLLIEDVDVISAIAEEFGQQCIVASVDVKLINGDLTVWTHNGNVKQNVSLNKWLENIATLPIGEVYLNSIDRDGTGHGYLSELIEQIPELFSIPVILAGGAGKHSHFSEVLKDERVDAVATANLLNFIGDGLKKSRQELLDEEFNLPLWDVNLATDLKNCF
jgi:imidazole glycerol-phosphate synthase subunit HisF